MLIAAGRKRNLLPVMAVRAVPMGGVGCWAARDSSDVDQPKRPHAARQVDVPLKCASPTVRCRKAGDAKDAVYGKPEPGRSRSVAYQPGLPGTVAPRSEHPRVSITPASATSPTAQAAIM